MTAAASNDTNGNQIPDELERANAIAKYVGTELLPAIKAAAIALAGVVAAIAGVVAGIRSAFAGLLG